MAKFTTDRARDWLKLDMAARLQSISSDAASLVHFSEGLVSRVQLLQDAAIGIINSDPASCSMSAAGQGRSLSPSPIDGLRGP